MRSFFVKRSSGADNLLFFFISAAASVLLTRVYLHIFNYPQISGGNFHIAHAIIGGIFLTASIVLLLTFHGKKIRHYSAVLGGIGFGQFIDEVGKFITKDNDYFYQPVPVIIYICFISLFFLYRWFDRYTPKSSKELSFDLIEYLEDLADNKFFQQHRDAIEKLIVKILETQETTYHGFARGLQKFIKALPLQVAPKKPFLYQGIQSSWKWLDDFTAERKPVFYFLIAVFIVYVVVTFWTLSVFLYRLTGGQFDPQVFGVSTRVEWYVYLAELVSLVVSALWMCQGLWKLVRRQRRRALLLFRNGLAVNILITHVFAFYIEQFSAAVSLFIVLILFFLVENILEEQTGGADA